MVPQDSPIIQLLTRSCMFLDDEKFEDYLGLFTGTLNYRITAYSPDLRKDLTLLDLNRGELEILFQNLRRHVRLPGRLLRHLGASAFEQLSGSTDCVVKTPIIVVHTDLEGSSKIFAAGKYIDNVESVYGKVLLRNREVRLDTRQFGTGSHLPI
jgi:methanesulfonate monooxygenase small subunit